ncbi:penicillin-binding protein activator [Novosphingobium tardum]|uniref:Penicillin-binding protein activator n=1 Tax=Novosphingobium tardum TaxID=1538021 RepID=A0ABV8RSB9_9SPHN
MIQRRQMLRTVSLAAGLAVLAGCKVIPRGPAESAPPPRPETETPSGGILPSDSQRHRVALLVPMSGANAAVGQSIANATTMALIDTDAKSLRITTYDTATGAQSAAARAIADGNKLILGPLLGDDVKTVASVARPARVPMITYSNDIGVAAPDVFVLGHVPGQAVERVVSYAKAKGMGRFGALIPAGEYGQRASAAFFSSVRNAGGTIVATETYDRGNTSVASAARRLKTKGPFDSILIADTSRVSVQAAPLLKATGAASPRILGNELWSGESAIMSSPALRGAWFASVSDARFRQFVSSYRSRFGSQPHRIATLGYDSVLLTIRIARDWRPGSAFPTSKLFDRGGFLGLDGAFRFARNGVAERSLEVREVTAGSVSVVSPAPARFND